MTKIINLPCKKIYAVAYRPSGIVFINKNADRGAKMIYLFRDREVENA